MLIPDYHSECRCTRTFYERELVISSRAHLPTWLPRTQRSRLVPAAMLESQISVGTQRGRHAIALRVPPGTPATRSPGRNLSHLEDVDGEVFQVSLSESPSKPPTHRLLRSKSLIGRRSDDQRRKHPLDLRGHPLRLLEILILLPCSTCKHTHTARGSR